MQALSAYIPIDRRHALGRGSWLPDRTTGAALFADISGFTPLTATLAAELGRKRGAEEVLRQINPVYDAIIAQLHRYGGSVIGFAGDAVTCWFDDKPIAPLLGTQKSASSRAVACALAMQEAMKQFSIVYTPAGTPVQLAIKVAIASGEARRFLVGDPTIQLLDALAGATLERMAAAEDQAEKGEVVVSQEVVLQLANELTIASWRVEPKTGRHFAVISASQASTVASWAPVEALPESMMSCWVVRPVYERLRTGVDFLGDLRLVTPLFLKFGGIDFDADDAAGEKINDYIRRVQEVLKRYEGTLIQLTIGDKGCFFYAAFGAPIAHDKDSQRAIAAALELRSLSQALEFISKVQIGISRGQVWTGNCGATTRRTYGVMGNQVNMAARLMGKAKPGQILVHERVQKATSDDFDFHSLGEIMVKGRATPLPVSEVIGRRATTLISQKGIRSPLIGRQEEVRRLRCALEAVSRPPAPNNGVGAAVSRVIIIEGEAGIGKSRLVAELEDQVQQRGLSSLLGAGQSIEQYTPYRAVRDIFELYFGLEKVTEQAERQQRVERLVKKVAASQIERLPLLNDVLNLGLPENELTGALNPSLRQQSLVSFLLTLLRAWAQEQPLILLIEDAHWLDSLSWEMVVQVTRGLISSNSPLLLLLVTRPMAEQSIGAQHLSSLRALEVTEALTLNQLSDEEVVALVTSRLGLPQGGVPQPVADLVRRRAEGNPFFAEELIFTLREQDLIRIEKEPTTHCVISGDLSEMSQKLPDTVQGLILARIDKLSAEKQLILKVAAVIGRTFAYIPLQWTLNQYIAHISQTLQKQIKELTSHALIASESDLSYIFKHIITQEVAYQTLLFAQRKQLHRKVASWYETSFATLAPYYPLLVHHYHHAEEKEQERYYARLAGERAAAQYANDEGIRYFSRALDLTPESDYLARYELLLAREKVFDWQGKREAQAQDLAFLSDLVTNLSDSAKSAAVRLRQANYGRVTSDYSNAVLAVQQAIAHAQEGQDVTTEAKSYRIWGLILLLTGHYESAQQQLQQALLLARRSQNQSVEADSLLNLGNINFYQRNYTLAKEYYEETFAIYQAIADRKGQASSLMMLGVVCTHTGEYLTGQQYYKQALNVCQTIGYRMGETLILGNLGVNYESLGEYEIAFDYQNKSLTICQEIGDREGEANCYCNLALIHYRFRDHENAIKHCKQALALDREIGNQSSQGYTLTYLGHTYADSGQLQLATEAYEKAIQIRRKLGQEKLVMDDLAGLARVEMRKENNKLAYRYVEEILAWIKANGYEGIEYPLEVYLTCYQVLQATADDTRAEAILSTAHDLLQEQANAIKDEQSRHKFLTNISFHREIRTAWEARKQ